MPGQTASTPTPLEVALRRLELCAYAVQEIHLEIEKPEDPEHKADLLLATEKLAVEAFELLATVKGYVWGDTSPFSDDDELEEENPRS